MNVCHYDVGIAHFQVFHRDVEFVVARAYAWIVHAIKALPPGLACGLIIDFVAVMPVIGPVRVTVPVLVPVVVPALEVTLGSRFAMVVVGVPYEIFVHYSVHGNSEWGLWLLAGASESPVVPVKRLVVR